MFQVVIDPIKEEIVKDKNILIVEDMYDTGHTMMTMINTLKEMKAKSVKTCVLMHKKNPDNLVYNYYCDYIAFFIPIIFVIGYGLDYNEYVRDMRHICSISKFGIEKYTVKE